MSKIETMIQPIVTTDRLVLRPLQASDAGPVEMIAADARVARMTTSIPHPYPPGAANAFIERARNAERVEQIWAMDGSADGGSEVMGLISLKQMDRNQSEVGYYVAPAYWNTGLASDALNALIEANPLSDTSMFGVVFQDNPASAAVLTHAGFEYIGDAEAFSVARDATVATWTYLRKLA
jgi:RimJ/RimL family protein N-acetyltransferase